MNSVKNRERERDQNIEKERVKDYRQKQCTLRASRNSRRPNQTQKGLKSCILRHRIKKKNRCV